MESEQKPEDIESSPPDNWIVRAFESLARITLAGFGGSLAGLSVERQQQQQTAHLAGSSSRPPMIRANNVNLPLTWAISCMMFALVLETCRHTSPTTSILSKWNLIPPESFNDEVKRTAIVSIGDYAIGGMTAGFAGAVGASRPPAYARLGARPSAAMRRQPFLLWGAGVGLGLGLLAGAVQAGAEVATLYLTREEQAEKERKR